MKKEIIIKVEKNGIIIPKEKLEEIKEGDLISLKITKIYADKEIKEKLGFAFPIYNKDSYY